MSRDDGYRGRVRADAEKPHTDTRGAMIDGAAARTAMSRDYAAYGYVPRGGVGASMQSSAQRNMNNGLVPGWEAPRVSSPYAGAGAGSAPFRDDRGLFIDGAQARESLSREFAEHGFVSRGSVGAAVQSCAQRNMNAGFVAGWEDSKYAGVSKGSGLTEPVPDDDSASDSPPDYDDGGDNGGYDDDSD